MYKAHEIHEENHSRQYWQQTAALAIDMHSQTRIVERTKNHTHETVCFHREAIDSPVFIDFFDFRNANIKRRVNVDRDL